MSQSDKLRRMFELLVQEHAPMLVSYLAAMTQSRADAEDLAQEAFLRAYRHFDRFGREGERKFAPWLRAIGRNLFIDRCRRAGRVVFSDPAILEGLDEVFEAADGYGRGDTWTDRVGSLRECLDGLPEGLGTVCRLHYFEELTARVIAERLEVQMAAVLKRLERSRTILRECIERKLRLGEAGG